MKKPWHWEEEQPPCAPAVNLISLYMFIPTVNNLRISTQKSFLYTMFHCDPQSHAEIKKRILRMWLDNANHQQQKKLRHPICSHFLSVVSHPTHSLQLHQHTVSCDSQLESGANTFLKRKPCLHLLWGSEQQFTLSCGSNDNISHHSTSWGFTLLFILWSILHWLQAEWEQ